MKGPGSRRLLAYVLLIAVASIAVDEFARRGLVEPTVAFGVSGALFLGNLAVAIGGLRTPQKLGWGAYLALSVATFLLFGFTTPVSAVILLAPLAGALMHEASPPS